LNSRQKGWVLQPASMFAWLCLTGEIPHMIGVAEPISQQVSDLQNILSQHLDQDAVQPHFAFQHFLQHYICQEQIQ